MALDMAKYRRIFIEESTDHLGEISRALLDLEKEMGSGEAIDTLFRMAHSIKSMAASLGYDAVAELSHRMEDRMEGVRSAGRVRDHEELALLFRGLETLEAMVAAVAGDEPIPDPDEALLAALAEVPTDSPAPAAPAALAEVPTDSPAPAASPEPVGGEPKKVPS